MAKEKFIYFYCKNCQNTGWDYDGEKCFCLAGERVHEHEWIDRKLKSKKRGRYQGMNPDREEKLRVVK